MERGKILHRAELLQRQEPDPSVSCRYELRLLPCRPEPGQTTRGSGKSQMGEFELESGGAILLGGPDPFLGERRVEFRLPAVTHVSAGDIGYFVYFKRLH